MITPNLARWAKDAKRRGKTPNLAYLQARDAQERRRQTPRHAVITFNPDWFILFPDFTEALRPAVEALGRAVRAFDGFYVPHRSDG